MVIKARETGSGGDRAPGPTPTEAYQPGDVVRYRVAPTGLAALVGGQRTFVVEETAFVESLFGCRKLYLIAAGDWRKWVTPANLVRVEPEAPSGFVTVPHPAPVPEPPKADGAKEYAAAQKAAVDEIAKGCGAPAKVVRPPEAGDVLADAAYTVVADLVWRGAGHNGLQTGDGRFAVTLSGGLYTAHDHWTGERSGGHALLVSAQQWCERRHVEGGRKLEWRAHPDGGTLRIAGEGTRNADHTFAVVGASGSRAGQFFGVDERFGYPHELRLSDYLPTRELAECWCEVRAACAAGPDGALRWLSPIPF
jgi:hypothetical protein